MSANEIGESADSSEIDLNSISMLIPKAKSGDLEAHAALLSQLQEFLQYLAKNHIGSALKHKAGESDIIQLTLLNAVENFESFRGNSSSEFRGWLKTILVNQVLDLRRQYGAQKREVSRERSTQNETDSGEMVLTDHRWRTPFTSAVAEEEVQLVHRAIQELPEDYATVIRLRSLDELPFDDVAKQMGRSYESVTKLWYRAMVQFDAITKRLQSE